MSTAQLLGSEKRGVPQSVKQWAAEDFAIAIGLLRECPYHGQPFKVRKGLTHKALSAGLVDLGDPIVQVFQGNMRELLAMVRRVTGHYGEYCEICAASDQEEFD